MAWIDAVDSAVRQLRWIERRFAAQDCLTMAGSLTFTSMLALVPVMTVVYLGLAYLPQYSALAVDVENFFFQNFVPNSSVQIQAKLSEFAGRAENLTVLGLISLAVTALMLILSIEKQFNAIWRVAMPTWGVRRVALLIGVMTVGPSLVLTGLWISTVILSLPFMSDVDHLVERASIFRYMPIFCLFILFSLLFKTVPNAHIKWSEAALGGLVTAAIFKVAFLLFARLSSYFVYDVIYGALAALPAFLVWLFLVWVILLFGAVFVCSLQQARESV
jgi:membrane protein